MTQNSSWIWRGGDNIAGLRLDREAGLLHWTTEIGCHCDSDASLSQPVADFRQNGPPPGVPLPPPDVQAEIESSLAP